MMVTVTDSQIRSWRLKGYSLERIALACGSTTCAISRRIQRIWQEEQQRSEMWGDPAPEQIKEGCAEIQQGWSEDVRRKREVGRGAQWRPAVVPVSLLERARG